MLINFFYLLRKTGVPVSIKELLVLLEALQERVAFCSIDDFYLLARLCLVKDEKFFDRYDRAFAAYFKDLENFEDILEAIIPEDWLRAEFMKSLSEEEKAKIESLGGLEKLLEAFKERLDEQKERHAGGKVANGLVPVGYHHSDIVVIIPRVFVLEEKAETKVRLKSGKNVSSRIWMTALNLVPEI